MGALFFCRPSEPQMAKTLPPRRKIDFDRIGNKILVVLYQRYMESNVFFFPFNEIVSAIPNEPRNAVWDELNSLVDKHHIVQKTEQRSAGFLALSSGRNETYEVRVDGYKISRSGIETVNKFTDEAYEVFITEISLVPLESQSKAKEDKWEPLPIDRQSTEFTKAVEAADIALKEIEGSNGYADSNPEERNSIVETIKVNLKNLKDGPISRGQIVEGLI
jgi:hypothetical protein